MSQVISKIVKQPNLTRNQVIVITTSAASLLIWTYNVLRRRQLASSRNGAKDEMDISYVEKEKKKLKTKHEPFSKTLSQLREILKQVVGPKEWTYAIGIAATLIVRTICDLWLINNGTLIESAIITADVSKLKKEIGTFFISMPTLALVNNLLKFFVNQLRLKLRYKLSMILYEKYAEGLTYYRLNVFDSSCQNIDQLLTADIEKFCNTIVDVYTNISKPLLDIIILVQRMSTTYTGASTPAAMIGYLLVAGSLLIRVRRPLTALTVKETQLEGQLRYVHTRLIANCEEIAFYQGNNREKLVLMNALNRLRSHLYDVSIFKFNIDYLDNMIARYFATVVGYLSLALPFFSSRYQSSSQSNRLEMYYKSGRMMVKLAESIGRLVLAGRDFSRLAAYTMRVSQLMTSIEDNRTNTGRYRAVSAISNNLPSDLVAGSGKVQLCDPCEPQIMFIDVPLCTPNGDLLVKSLNLTIKLGHNVIITGPNGSGKSSLFRLLGELWPLYGGKLIKPASNRLFYIPQKPYLALGTFRDQLIYPDTPVDMTRKGICDNELKKILEIVELGYLLERENWDSIQDWQDVLSGGEKQRVAIGRLIYHKPLFAILDECTSAVSVDVEQNIYRFLSENINCSLLSVTHRVKQLQNFHQYVLRFDGCGGCVYEPLLEGDDSVVL